MHMPIWNDLLYAIDPVEFSRHIGIEPDGWQADFLRSEGRRVLLNCCRQSGKTTTAATKGLHTAVYRPKSLILLVSPSLRQSQEVFRKVKAGYEAMDGKPGLVEDNKLSLTMANGSRIVALPSEQATVRGFSGVDLIIEDEAAQVHDDFHKAVMPMLITSGGAMVCMSTPYGKRGHFHDYWTNGGGDWQRVEIPAASCPRISDEELERQRRSLGDMFFRQEFCCEFTETVNSVFSYDAIQGAFCDDVAPLFGEAGQAWQNS
jgi:hypothetical protein